MIALPCESNGRLNCNGHGTCVNLPPNDQCNCFSGYTGDACDSVDSAITGATTGLVVGAIAGGVASSASSSFMGGGGGGGGGGGTGAGAITISGYGILPLLLYMQQFVIPLAHNGDLNDVYKAFEIMNYLQINRESDDSQRQTIDWSSSASVVEYSHGW